jgi:hypothetical protein
MAETVPPEFLRFVAAERKAGRIAAAREDMGEGEVDRPVLLDTDESTRLLRVAALRAAGFFRPTRRREVVWVEGGNELAVGIGDVDLHLGDGLIRVRIPVRCDQSGPAEVEVLFATGSPLQPAGLYAATSRQPKGPSVIVEAWGEALVAFAWRCVLELVCGIAGATGKDRRGNRLVPVELSVSARGIGIVPMARHRFSGSSTLKG